VREVRIEREVLAHGEREGPQRERQETKALAQLATGDEGIHLLVCTCRGRELRTFVGAAAGWSERWR
jgi:hypothetical protein